jgi:hypothetical protein
MSSSGERIGSCLGSFLIVDSLKMRLAARKAAPAERPYLR